MSPAKIKVERKELVKAFMGKWKLSKLVKRFTRANKKIMKALFQHLMGNVPKDLIQAYMYVTAEDDKVCERCSRLHGMVFPVTDDAHRPPIHPNCRCYTQPAVVDVLTMKIEKLGGKVYINHDKAFDLEYGAITTDGQKIGWDEATGFINRSINNVADTILKTLEEEIDQFFR